MESIPTGTRAFRTGLTHMALNLIVTCAYIGNFLWRHAQHGERSPGPRGAPRFSIEKPLPSVHAAASICAGAGGCAGPDGRL